MVFLGALLYAIGFVGDFVVPRTVSGGVAAPLGEAVVVKLVLLAVFAVQLPPSPSSVASVEVQAASEQAARSVANPKPKIDFLTLIIFVPLLLADETS